MFYLKGKFYRKYNHFYLKNIEKIENTICQKIKRRRSVADCGGLEIDHVFDWGSPPHRVKCPIPIYKINAWKNAINLNKKKKTKLNEEGRLAIAIFTMDGKK